MNHSNPGETSSRTLFRELQKEENIRRANLKKRIAGYASIFFFGFGFLSGAFFVLVLWFLSAPS